MIVFKSGDRVRIQYGQQTVEGQVVIAADNGKSLALVFDAMLGGYVQMMPVLFDGEFFRDLVQGEVVGIIKSHDGGNNDGLHAIGKGN